MHVLYFDLCACISVFRYCRHGEITNGIGYFAFAVLPCLHSNDRVFAVDFGSHLDPGRAVLYQFKMVFRNDDKIDIAVDAAVEGKVCLLRINTIVGAVVSCHADDILIFKILKLHTECGIAAFMMSKLFTVEEYLRCMGDAIELQKCPAIGLRLFKTFDICCRSPPVIVSAVLSVLAVPGMRKRNAFPVVRK